MISERQIEELAHTMWEKDGLIEGMYLEHYSRAKEVLEERQSPHTKLSVSPSSKSSRENQNSPLRAPPVPGLPPGPYRYRRHTRR
jgi:hypothetical protein